MSPEAQRRAIAESLGWTLRKSVFHNGNWHDVPTWFAPEYKDWPADSCPAGQILGGHLPDYLRDLNAMHEPERRLTLDQRDVYLSWLGRITEKGRTATREWTNTTATAAQRAEAYLRTIGKWKD